MRRSICVPVFAALTVALSAACSGPTTGARAAGGDAAATTRFPALRFAPERPTYALASGRTADLVSATREVLAAIGLLADGDMGELDREATRDFGFNPFSLDTLTAAGVDASGSAVLFSSDFLPTLVLPVSDPDKLDAFLAKLRPKRGLQVRQYRDRDWFSYTIDKPLSVQWIRWDEYLAVRLNMDEKVESVAWLDDMFDSSQSLGRSPVMRKALTTIDGRVSDAKVAGIIDLAGIFRSIIDKIPDEEEAEKYANCVDIFAPLSGAIAVGAHLDWGSAEGVLKFGLKKSAAAAVRKHVMVPPPGYAKVRDQAALYASLGLDLAWLDEERAALECALWEEPLIGKKGTFKHLPTTMKAAFAAILDLRPSEGEARAVGFLGFRGTKLIDAVLGMIPQRRFLERKSTIADQPVRVVALPLLPKLIYQRKEDSLLMSIGDGVMTEVLQAPARADKKRGLDVLSLGIYPSRLPELEGILVRIARYMQISRNFATASARRLKRYEYGRVDVTLEGNDLVMRLAMGLARK